MRIHLYAQCWNDEPMLPFFFRHYDKFVDRYIIFDDGSSDRSLSILANHPRVQVRGFIRSDPASFALSEQSLSNECWKESRGKAHWVIVTDIDEHLFHPSMLDYLRMSAASGVTMIPALGFQMISENFPGDDDDTLCEAHPYGTPWAQMMKPSIFNPDQIEEIGFALGRHQAEPIGNIRVPDRDEILLLHYKYLNIERTHARHLELGARLGSRDLDNQWGHKYFWSLDDLREDWSRVLLKRVDIRKISTDPAASYPLERWWAKYRVTAHPRC
jgi:Glycosyl transferase family 2